jgi:hypothetical protein
MNNGGIITKPSLAASPAARHMANNSTINIQVPKYKNGRWRIDSIAASRPACSPNGGRAWATARSTKNIKGGGKTMFGRKKRFF